MPHVIVKLAAGRSEEQKQMLARRVVEALTSTVGCDEDAVSVDVEDIPMANWTDEVYVPEIEPNLDRLYKKPGYGQTLRKGEGDDADDLPMTGEEVAPQA